MISPSANFAVTKSCDLCQGNEFQTISDRDRRGDALLTDICQHCGLVSHHDIPTAEQLQHFYAHEYRWQYHGERKPSPRRVMRAWKNGRRIATRLIPQFNRQTPILEIGAGLGCNVKALSMAGFPASGIEPNLDFQKYAVEHLQAKVTNDTLENLKGDQTHQAILLVHVIEHLRSPTAAFRQIHQLLREDGLLYIECPNLAGPFAPPAKLFHFAHIHNFTHETMRHLAEHNGFELVEQYTPHSNQNVEMLFRKAAQVTTRPFASDAAQQTLKAAFRYGPWRYHLRPAYLRQRVRKLSGYVEEHLLANRWESQFTAANHTKLRTTKVSFRSAKA